MRRILPTILALLTGHDRYFPEIQWSRACWTSNIFRVYEWLFGRRFGIRRESVVCYGKVGGVETVVHRLYTVEAVLSYAEGLLREYLKNWELGFKFVRIPQFAIAGGGQMPGIFNFAIAYEAEGQAYVGSGTATASFSLTTAGSDRIITGFTYDQTTSQTTTATYNSIAMTEVTNFTPSGTAPFRFYSFYQVNPTIGSNTCAATRSGTSNDYYFFAGTYSGAKQTGQPDNSVTNQSLATVTSLTFTLTTVADNCWTTLGAASNWGGLAASTGSTLRGSVINSFGGYFDSNAAKTPAGSTSMTISCSTGTPSFWGPGGIMLSIAPAVASGPANLKSFDGNLKANIKSIMGNVIANVKSLSGNS